MFFMSLKHEDDLPKAERLYYNYRTLMYTEAFRILQDKHLAEDAVQESFERILPNLHKIDDSDTARTKSFLVIVCRNVAINIYNSRIHLNKLENIEEHLSTKDIPAVTDPLDILVNRETLEKISDVLCDMPDGYRDPLLLKQGCGFNRTEISSMLGIGVETVKKRLVRGKAKLVKESFEKGLI